MGSEEEVAMQVIRAAASRHQVWVLAHRDSAPDIVAELERLGLSDRVTVEALHVDPPLPGSRDRSLPVRHWAYDAWQKAAESKVIAMDREHNFDVVHHATIASYWTRCALAVLDKPFVLGPVGGGVTCPPGLLPVLGLRGAIGYGCRSITRHAFGLRPQVRKAWRKATVVLTQNYETASRIPDDCNVEVYTNATSGSVLVASPDQPRDGDLVYAGRLLPWKGVSIALRVLASLRHSDARLFIYGDGPDKPRIVALVEKLGLSDRVLFPGRISRRKLHQHVATAGCLIHPALHEEGGLAMWEAMALGTPVVALNRGGVVQLDRVVPDAPVRLVDASSPKRTVRRMATAVDQFLDNPPPVLQTPSPPSPTFDQMILGTYAKAVELFAAKKAMKIPATEFDRGELVQTENSSVA